MKRYFDLKCGLNPRCHLHYQQRMPAESEEIIVDANFLDTKHFCPDISQYCFSRIARRNIATCQLFTDIRGRQGCAIQLAVGCQRKTVQKYKD